MSSGVSWILTAKYGLSLPGQLNASQTDMTSEQITNKKPFFALLDAARKEPIMQFSRLTTKDVPAISRLMQSVWPQQYGKVGCPDYSEDYLKWVFGGPNANKHILFGAKVNGEFVAYQSFLYRTVAYGGKQFRAYLNTHVTASPTLDLRSRIDCGIQMVEQHVLFDPRSRYHDPTCDLVYFFYEKNKSLRAVGDSILTKYFQINREVISEFRQFIVLPDKLKKNDVDNAYGQTSGLQRAASQEDVRSIGELMDRSLLATEFTRVMSEEEMRHHLFGHPGHHTTVIERDGAVKAFIHYYPLSFIKDGKHIRYIIVEFLHFDRGKLRDAVDLLREAVDLAGRTEARSVVLENATYMHFDDCRRIGLMPTLRQMVLGVCPSADQFKSPCTFFCDVK
jgi:hypothetical protein